MKTLSYYCLVISVGILAVACSLKRSESPFCQVTRSPDRSIWYTILPSDESELFDTLFLEVDTTGKILTHIVMKDDTSFTSLYKNGVVSSNTVATPDSQKYITVYKRRIKPFRKLQENAAGKLEGEWLEYDTLTSKLKDQKWYTNGRLDSAYRYINDSTARRWAF